jgi:phosphoribosylformylglycinamidine cyclo-ligase
MARKARKSGPVTYRTAGVNIEAGEALVEKIKSMVQGTHSPRVMGNYGGFAGLFRLDFGEKLFAKKYREPVLAACADGVGTKLKIAFKMNVLDTIGIDLVAMNVNDLTCIGAEPLFFLDYLATGKLDPEKMSDIIRGIATGCRLAGCSLLGGETAEMPGFYPGGEFDLAGFAVGVIERRDIIDGRNVCPGDIVIGLASSGVHSNGFGLARQVLLSIAKFKLPDRPDELEGRSIGEVLLEPTRIYTKSVMGVLGSYRVKRPVKAMAHITGGGLEGNLSRVIPGGMSVRINEDCWTTPPIFDLIARKGPVDHIEMRRVFNMGVGYTMIVAPYYASAIMNRLAASGERCFIIGKVRKGSQPIQWK